MPVALVGAELLDGKFIIKKSKIRGEVSEGMICSGKELGVNSDESGIMIIDDLAIPGVGAAVQKFNWANYEELPISK